MPGFKSVQSGEFLFNFTITNTRLICYYVRISYLQSVMLTLMFNLNALNIFGTDFLTNRRSIITDLSN